MDVGLSGGALHTANLARSYRSEVVGNLNVARSSYTFPGFNGLLSHTFGDRGRPISWDLILRCVDESVLHQIRANMDAAKRGGEFSFPTSTGYVFQRVTLNVAQPIEPFDTIRGGALAGWIRQRFRLEFEVLSAD